MNATVQGLADAGRVRAGEKATMTSAGRIEGESEKDAPTRMHEVAGDESDLPSPLTRDVYAAAELDRRHESTESLMQRAREQFN